MNNRHSMLLLGAICLAIGLCQPATAQNRIRRSHEKQSHSTARRSNDRQSHSTSRRSASGGSVRYHRSRSQSSDRGGRESGHHSSRSDRSSAGGRGASERRSSTTIERRTTTGVRTYSSRERDHASFGSLRHYRPLTRSVVQYPAVLPRHDIHVQKYPRYGTRITVLPSHRSEVTYHGRRYYFSDGVYYRSYSHNVYAVVRPPIGVRLPFLPDGYISITIGGRPYYRYENTYYVREIIDQRPVYVVVQPPSDIVLDVLPPGCQAIQYHGRLYYVDVYEETAYAPVIIDGFTRYRPTDLDVDVDFDDGRVKIEIDD